MRRNHYISSLLLLIFTITTLTRLVAGVMGCDCSGHSHNDTSTCSIEHSDDSHTHCHHIPSWGHCCGKHFDTQLEYEPQTTSQQSKRGISINVATILCDILSHAYLGDELITTSRESLELRHRILSQWHSPSLRQRPPPVLV